MSVAVFFFEQAYLRSVLLLAFGGLGGSVDGHLARAVELRVRLNDQGLRLHLAFDLAGSTQGEGLRISNLAVKRALYLRVLAGYGTFNQAFLAYYHFACALQFAFYGAVNADITVGDDSTDDLTAGRDCVVHCARLLCLICHIVTK